jgi:hypothetical protein
MSRRDNHSFPLRGMPLELLRALNARPGVDKNAIVLAVVREYAAGNITPKASPPPFDPNRGKAEAYGPQTGEMAVSGIPRDVFEQFMTRAKREGWFSKNQLIIELLREAV